MSWRFARWRIRCHVRRRPPLSSGRSRSDLSHRIRIGVHCLGRRQDLHSLLIDEGAEPELEIEQAPETVGAVDAAARVIAQQLLDGPWISDAAFAGPAIEQHV